MVTLFQTLHTLSYVVADRLKTVKEEKGASAIEYAILVACIAAIVIAAVALLGTKIKSLFDGITLSSTPTAASGTRGGVLRRPAAGRPHHPQNQECTRVRHARTAPPSLDQPTAG